MTAVGRRIRRNYLWILLIQTVAYVGKLVVHPDPIETLEQALDRADIGPIPGLVVLTIGAFYVASWIGISIWSVQTDAARARSRRAGSGMG